MAAGRLCYVIIYKGESQVYGSTSKEIALRSPPPPGVSIEDKFIGFISWEPDNEKLVLHLLPDEEVLTAELDPVKIPKAKKEDE